MKKLLIASVLALCISGCPEVDGESTETEDIAPVKDATCVDDGWHRQDVADRCDACLDCCVDDACLNTGGEQ